LRRFSTTRPVDAVILATPPWVTPALVRAALEAGKYVLAEKPLAPTLAEQLMLRDLPGALDRLQVGLTYRHHPAVDRLRELVAADAFGRPLYIQISVCDERADPVGEPDHYARRRQALEHALPVVLDGIHACDRLNLMLGEAPVELTGWALTSSPDFASPNVNGASLTYADGTIVRLEVVWLYPTLRPESVRRHRPTRSSGASPAHVRTADRDRREERGRDAARRQDRVLLRAPARTLPYRMQRRHPGGPGPRGCARGK